MRPVSLAISLALIAASGLAAVLPAAAGQAAPVPTLEVGKRVGYGTTVDLGVLVKPLIDRAKAQDLADDNITIHELSFTGSLDVWNVVEVTEKTTTYYGLKEDSASGVRARLVSDITSTELPAPGTYPGTTSFGFCTFPPYPMATRRVSVSFEVTSLVTSSGTSQWNVSDLALRESTANSVFDLRASSSGRGIPNTDLNFTTCRATVSYEDFDYSVIVDIDAQDRVVFSPALDVFDFPIAPGESWDANSTATASGSFKGTVDALGITPEDEQRFFSDLNNAFRAVPGLSVTGLTGFPIDLEAITVTVGLVRYYDQGTLRPFSYPVNLRLNATERLITLADGNPHQVYLISATPDTTYTPGFPQSQRTTITQIGTPSTSLAAWVYSPSDGLIVGFTVEVLPGVPVFELRNVPPSEAQNNVESTKGAYAPNPPAGNPILDFFLKPPYVGILLVAAAVLFATFLVVRWRRRPAVPPPPGPPEPPTPPPWTPPPETP